MKLGGGGGKNLRVAKDLNHDPAVFKEFTGEKPNPFAMENVKPPELPDHNRYILETPLSNTVALEWFQPFGLQVVKIQELNYYKYLEWVIDEEDVIYKKLDPVTFTLYNNGITHDLRDVPPEDNKFFEGLFSMYIRDRSVRSVTLYARVFYQSRRGQAVYKTTNTNYLFTGASDILEITLKQEKIKVDDPFGQGTIFNIRYKIKHDPWNQYPDGWPFNVFANPRPGLYDFLLVVTDRRSLIEQPVGDPIDYYTNKEHTVIRRRVLAKPIFHGLNLTLLNEDFNNENAVIDNLSDNDLYNGNVFVWNWYPNASTKLATFPHSVVPNVIVTADNYTQAEYDTYSNIPVVDSRRFLPINAEHPFQTDYQYCFNASSYKNINVSESFLRLINPGQPSSTLFVNDFDYKINSTLVTFSNYDRSIGGVQGRSFLYGKISAKIKFPQLLNTNNLPNGLFSAFWLYEFHHGGIPISYHHHCLNGGVMNDNKQLYEIDIEINPSNTPGNISVGLGIIDYNCGPHVYSLNGIENFYRGPMWTNNGYTFQRVVAPQKNADGVITGYITGVVHYWDTDKSFLNTPHIYTIDWDYDRVVIYIDGIESAVFTSEDVKIPDVEMAIRFSNNWKDESWVNNKGYELQNIPFPATDQAIEVDWVKLE